MGLDAQLAALQRRANKVLKAVNPPELKLNIFNEKDYKDKEIPLTESQWEMNLIIEDKKAWNIKQDEQ